MHAWILHIFRSGSLLNHAVHAACNRFRWTIIPRNPVGTLSTTHIPPHDVPSIYCATTSTSYHHPPLFFCYFVLASRYTYCFDIEFPSLTSFYWSASLALYKWGLVFFTWSCTDSLMLTFGFITRSISFSSWFFSFSFLIPRFVPSGGVMRTILRVNVLTLSDRFSYDIHDPDYVLIKWALWLVWFLFWVASTHFSVSISHIYFISQCPMKGWTEYFIHVVLCPVVCRDWLCSPPVDIET